MLREAHSLKDIPVVLIYGRLDMGTPLSGAEELSRAWPGSELIVVDDAGHETRTPGMRQSIVGALDGYASSP